MRENLTVAANHPSLVTTLKDIFTNRGQTNDAVDEALDVFGLGPLAEATPSELTQGQRKLVAVCRALAARPKLLCLDEPAAGLDAQESLAFGGHLREIVDRGTPILLIDHDMAVMFQADGQTPWFDKSTDESLSLWSERADEFVQAVLDARETYHADVAAICANQAEQLAQLAAPAEDAAALAAWSASAAAILQQAHDDLTALTTPLVTDTTAYARFYGNLIRLARNLQDSADAVTAAGSTQQDELRAEYLDIRSSMSSGPQGSGLEQCVASLPS